MNSNVPLFLISSFCYYFVNCVNNTYYEEYVLLFKNAVSKNNNLSVEKFYNIVCSLDLDPEQLKQRLRRATICKNAIRRLRDIKEDGFEDSYMDYHRFLKEPNCDFVKVLIPPYITANQSVVFCPYRPSFIPLNTNYHLQIKNSDIIAVFPKSTKKLMFFKPILQPNGKIELWKLSKIINNLMWNRNKKVEREVFDIIVPYSYSKTQDMFNLLSYNTEYLYEKSKDKNHILNSGMIPKICKIVCRPGKYKEFIHSNTITIKNQEAKKEKVTLFSEEPGKYVQFSTKVYKCYREIQKIPRTYADDYGITAGPSDDSIILLHKTNDVLKAIEFILNLNINYVDTYDSY